MKISMLFATINILRNTWKDMEIGYYKKKQRTKKKILERVEFKNSVAGLEDKSWGNLPPTPPKWVLEQRSRRFFKRIRKPKQFLFNKNNSNNKNFRKKKKKKKKNEGERIEGRKSSSG